MKDLLLKKGIYVLLYAGLAIFLEVITFLSMKNGVVPQYFLLDLAVIAMISTVIFVLPSFTLQAILIVALLVLQFILSFLNYTLNNMNGSVFTLEMMNLANEAAGAFTSDFMDWGFFFLLIAVPVVAIVALILLKKMRVPYDFSKQMIFFLVTAFALMSIGTSSLYNLTVKNLYDPEDKSDPLYLLTSDAYLYRTFVLKDSAFKKFGTFAFYYASVDRIIANNLSSAVFWEGQKGGAVLAEELTTLNNYFGEQEESGVSAYSGILDGQNVITIMIESGEWYAIDPVLTPTLYALSTQGYSNTNYYSRDKTNHSEAIGILGSYPVETPFTSNYSSNDTLLENDLAFTLPSVLRREGYRTSYFHSNWGSYYGRETTHPVYGFTDFYALEHMAALPESTDRTKDFYEFVLDSALFGGNLEQIAPTNGEPFYSYVTTLVTHGHYDELLKYGDYTADLSEEERAARAGKYAIKGLEEYYLQITFEGFLEKFGENLEVNGFVSNGEINPDRAEDLWEIYLRYKRFQASFMDFDRGVALLLNHLEENGLLDNTALVFYADHAAYYSDQQYYLKGIKKGNYADVTSYNVPFFVYSGKSPLTVAATGFNHQGDAEYLLSSSSSAEFCSSFSIVPTMLDLLGYSYNRGLYMGNSIFSDESDIAFVSRESGILTDEYFSSDGIEILYGDVENAEGVRDFQKKAVNYLTKQQYFEKMYLYDFFSYADGYENADVDRLVYKRQITE